MASPCKDWEGTDNTKTKISDECIRHKWNEAGCVTKPYYLIDPTDVQKGITEGYTLAALQENIDLHSDMTDPTTEGATSTTANQETCYGGCMDWVKDKTKTSLSQKCVTTLWENGTGCEAEPKHFYDKDEGLKKEFKKLNLEKFKKKIKKIAAKKSYKDEYICDGKYSNKTIMIFVIAFIIVMTVFKSVVMPPPRY